MSGIPACRCLRCTRQWCPPVPYCPECAGTTEPLDAPPYGRVLTYTTLYSPPEGFSSPLHIALVELPGGARFFCHGEATKELRMGRTVAIESLDDVYYFSHLGMGERVRLFWRRSGERSEKVSAIVRSTVKRLMSRVTSRPEEEP